MREYGRNYIGESAKIFEPVTLGFPSRDNLSKAEFTGTTIGKNAIIRSGSVIYCDVVIGDDFQTGHNVIIREKTTIGNLVAIGTATVIEGNCRIGNHVSIQSMVYIPIDTTVEDNVFIGPNAVLTNDRYPPIRIGGLKGPYIRKGAVIGANSTLLPGVCIGEGALVAAGAVVTRDVPDYMLAVGSPAKIRDLPRQLAANRTHEKYPA